MSRQNDDRSPKRLVDVTRKRVGSTNIRSSRGCEQQQRPPSSVGVGNVLSIIGNTVASVPGVITHPIRKMRNGLMEEKKDDEPAASADGGDGSTAEPMTLEGMMYYKKGGRGKPFKWKRRYVVLDMADGGSVSCFRTKDKGEKAKEMLRQMATSLKKRDSEEAKKEKPAGADEDVCLLFPCDLPWVVKDLCYDPRMFAIEVPTSAESVDDVILQQDDDDDESNVDDDETIVTETRFVEMDPSLPPVAEDDVVCETSAMGETELESLLVDKLEDEIIEAQQMNKKRLRFYFKCVRTGNEKALWLRAFAKIDRMSSESSKKGMILGSLAKAVSSNTRIRSETSASFARETRQLERIFSGQSLDVDDALEDISKLHITESGKEFRVEPTYAYPHRWMTSAELREEMTLPSAHFHDLRLPSKRGEEIGVLKVEVLQCIGLPKLDRVSETDAVVYLVVGSYAFATDVINDCASPMWLRKTRRACIFPIFDGYARLYAGVFDDDGIGAKDDLAGRIAIDLARLRPGCQYDVTLPLRVSTQVYSRRKRGSIRLRFQLDWKSERSALLSYLPRKLPIPKNIKPNTSTTVLCCDEKAFRNVAITVHGAHLPGRFSPKHFRAMLREINFTRKLVLIMIRSQLKDTMMWKKPTISLFVFCAWMHCIQKNQFSLVLPYLIVFWLIHMVKNYAKYGLDGPTQLCFVPLSCEEMFLALLRGESVQSFAPLEMEYVGGESEYVYKTHEPWGKKELSLIGLGPTQEELEAPNVEEEHMEFAFASGKRYPRLTVEEARVERPSKTKSNKEVTTGPNAAILKGALAKIFRDRNVDNGDPFGDDTKTGNRSDGSGRDIPRSDSGDLLEEVFETFESSSYNNGSFDIKESESSDSNLPPRLRIPEQDMDRNGGGGNDKSIVEDIMEVKMKLHDITLQQFNDQAYTIKDPDALYFGQSQSRKRKADEDVAKQLDKLLGLGQYSNGNMIVGKIAPYVEPIIGGANSFICLFRALFNIFTWRDPFLSFWVTLVGIVLAAVLFVFPWRIVLFVAGLVLVGPQNWAYRIVKERKDFVSQTVAQSRGDVSSTDETASCDSDDDDEEDSTEPSLPVDQPVFRGHGEPNQRQAELDLREVNPREVHHVVVPYSQLMYHRMYDWPPEPKYSKVRIPPPKAPVLQGSSRKSPSTSNRSPSSLRRKSFFAASFDSSVRRDGGSCSNSVRRRGGGSRSRKFSGDDSLSLSRRKHTSSGHSSRPGTCTTNNTSLGEF